MLPQIIPHSWAPRGWDAYGSGAWLAPRSGRKHAGVDYVFEPGDPVCSPVNGYMFRPVSPYIDDLTISGLILRSEALGLHVVMLYLEVLVERMCPVLEGQLLGYAQDLRSRYPKTARRYAAITSHVHVSVVTPRNHPLLRTLREGVDWLWLPGGRPMPGAHVNPELLRRGDPC